ncbi:MAG: amino acid permease [Thermoplasmata archaeon]|nr:amino acid permease [Thermoplasmata archaeon]
MASQLTPKLSFRRELGLLEATMIGVGAMTGASIFILAGTAVELAGPAAIVVIFLNAFVTLLTALGYAEMGASYPEAGGGYLWVKKSLPKPFDFVSGWISWFGHTIACAFYTVVFAMGIDWLISIYGFTVSFPYFHQALILTVLGIFTTINILGSKTTGRTETIITLSQIAIILFFVVAGVLALFRNPEAWSHFTPFFPRIDGIFVAMGVLFIAFEGYEIIAQSAEEVKNPEKNIPRAILLSVGIVMLLYVALLIALLAILPVEEIAGMGEFAVIGGISQVIPKYGAGIMIIGLLIGTTATLNATIYSSARVSFAMGRDGTFPKFFGKIHPKTRTPYISTLISACLIGSIAIALPIRDIVASADIMFLLLFILTNISWILLRYGEPNVKKPFKVPLFPLVPVLAIITMCAIAVMLYSFSQVAWYLAIIWIEIGAAVHYFGGGQRRVEERADERSVLGEMISIDRKKYSVLVCVPPGDNVVPMVHMASKIARNNRGDVLLYSVIEVPRQISIKSIGYRDAEETVKKLEKLRTITRKYDIASDYFISVSHTLVDAIADFAEEVDANLVILGWRGRFKKGFILGSHLPALLKKIKADTVIYKPPHGKVPNKVTLVNKLGSDLSLAMKIAHLVAKEYSAEVEILNVVPERKRINVAIEMFASIEGSFKQEAIPVRSSYIVLSEIKHKLQGINTGFLIMNADDIWDVVEYLLGTKISSMEKAKFGVFLVHRYKKEEKLSGEEIAMMHH